MSTKTPTEEDILRPINTLSKKYFIVYGLAMLAVLVFLVGWVLQLEHGLVVTGMSDWGSGGGATWGVYIGSMIWWVGIAHGGIILSAAVRLLKMDRYMPVARIAELTTVAGLSAAGTMIIVHLGRPDRMVVSILTHFHVTVNNSPLVWDVTVITAYLVMTVTYLGLTVRYDIVRLRDDLPDHFEPIYKVLTLGYSEKEDAIIQRMVWWLALAVIIMAPLLLHGGVIPWLFALIPTMPAWFGAVQGPQFLTIALSSAISGIIIVSYGFRRAYGWEHIITDDIFRGLTLWLGFFCLLFLWLQLQQIITGVYSAPLDVSHAMEAKITNPVYILALGLVAGSLGYIFGQAVRPSLFTKARSIAAGLAVLTGTLLEKVLFVAEGTLHPTFELYEAVPGHYIPSPIEIAAILGMIGMVTILFLTVSKVVPIVELHAIEHLQEEREAGESSTNPEVEA